MVKTKEKETTAIVTKSDSAIQLQEMVNAEGERRKIITHYIANNMVKGSDYGGIHVYKNCANKYACKIPTHFSKDCLFKSGSEKFASLMRMTIRFRIDKETWEMAGSTPGLFCYVAELVDPRGTIVGEGRGSCSIDEKGSANTAIKIAQKRAQVDAILRSGGLSDFFTQDLEDMHDAEPVPVTQPAPQMRPEPVETQDDDPDWIKDEPTHERSEQEKENLCSEHGVKMVMSKKGGLYHMERNSTGETRFCNGKGFGKWLAPL